MIPPCQRSRYATYFDVAVLRCLLQPHWSEEGTQWSLMYYLQRLRHMLEEKPEKPPEPDIPLLPRPRSSSMVAAAPSLVNTHKTQVRQMKSIVIWANTFSCNTFSFSSHASSSYVFQWWLEWVTLLLIFHHWALLLLIYHWKKYTSCTLI
jgi:hypothetical protein